MRHNCTRALLIAASISLLWACETTEELTDGGPTPSEGGTPDQGAPPSGVVTYKNAGESAEADFSNGDEQYLVVPYSVSTTASSGIDYEIKLTAGGSSSEDAGAATADAGLGSSSFKLKHRPPQPLSVRNPQLWARWQQRLAVERWSRSLAERAAKAKMRAPHDGLDSKLAACTTSADCTAASEVCHEGQCTASVTVKVDSFSTAASTINAEVKKKGQIAAILVDTEDTVDQANIDAMLEKFESLLYPRDVALFGNPELKSGEPTLASDRNGDGLVWLVFTSKVQEKNAVGFFVATDFDDSDAKSNKADILYIDAGLTDLKAAYRTIAHEFQHLLSFSSKVYKPSVNGGSGALEALWLDEGQSHFAEDACGYGGENTTVLDQEVFTAFSDQSMLATDSADDSLAMRGVAFTFVRYLFEQKGGVSYESDGGITDKGGAALLKAFHTSSKQGVDAVSEAYGDFKGAFDGWIAAIALDGRGVTDFGAYNFAELITDPVTGNQVGVKIRGTRKDETGADVELAGPIEDDLTADTSGAIPNAAGKLYLLKGQSGKVQVSVTTQDTDFRFALIKIK